MKKFFTLFGIFVATMFIIWILFIFPYPSSTKTQIAITKHDLIEGILQREIVLRDLYAKAHNNTFFTDKGFLEKIDKERKKFYKYCDNGDLLDYKGKYCEISRGTSLFDLNRYTTYRIKYKFDNQSETFFNHIKIFMAYKKDDLNRDIFWIPKEDDRLVYRVKTTGYSVLYSFFNNETRVTHHLLGIPYYELDSNAPIEKNNLISIKSQVDFNCSKLIEDKNCKVAFKRIHAYIGKNKI